RLANRATLIAIQSLSGAGDPAAFAEELKLLAREVRDATDRTQRFAQDIEVAVDEADARMRAAREHALARMEDEGWAAQPHGPVAAVQAGAADTLRLIERVLEMVQDAGVKGERVSTASERASSVAERLARRLDANASDAEALVVRLAPVGEPAGAEPPAAPELRLIDGEEVPEDEPRDAGSIGPRPGAEGEQRP